MKNFQLLITLSLLIGSFFSLAASPLSLQISPKAHIGFQNSNLPVSHLVEQVYSSEAHQVTKDFWQYDALGSTVATKSGDVTVYRAFGGDSRAQGFSWTTKDPRTVNNFRDKAGLPSGGASGANNTADFLISACPKSL